MEDFLKEDMSARYLNSSNTYIQYTGQYKKGIHIYKTNQISQIYDVLLDFDYLNYVKIQEESTDKQKDFTIFQLQKSKLWIKLQNNEYVHLNAIKPDNTTYLYTQFSSNVYLPSIIYINDVENVETDQIYITFALDEKNPKQPKKQNKIQEKLNMNMFKTLKKDDSIGKINKVANLDESQQQLLQVLQRCQKIHLTVYNLPSFITPISQMHFLNSIFMQTLLKSKVYTINILIPENLKPNASVFTLLAYFAGSSYGIGNITDLKLNKGINNEQAQKMRHKRIAILSDSSFGEDPNSIFEYHSNLITWIQEQRNFMYKTISAVRDYYKYVEFKPPYIQNFNLNHEIAKSPYFMFAFLETKRSYKNFNLILASEGSFKFYNDNIQEGRPLYNQYFKIIRKLPGEVNYYTINSRKNIQHQLFSTDTEIYANQGEYEKIMAKEYEEKQNFSSIMGYIINNFFIFVLIKNERLYVEKMHKSALFFLQQFILISLSISLCIPLQTFVPLIKYFLYRNKPYYMSQFVNNFFLFRTLKKEDGLKKFLITTTQISFLVNIFFIIANVFSTIASLDVLSNFNNKLTYDFFILFLTFGNTMYIAGVIVLNIFIVIVVFQIQEENIQLQNQNILNDLGIPQENFYLELMQDFQDQHLNFNIPEIPQNEETKSLYNIHTSSYISSSQKLGKAWISITQLMIFFAQRGNVLTKDKVYYEIYKENIKKGLSNSKAKILILSFFFILLIRVLGLVYLKYQYNFNNDPLLIAYSIMTVSGYTVMGYQVLIVKFWVQRNKRRTIQRVLNMIKPRYMEVDIPDVYKNIANEIPIINVACVNSWTQWMNYYSLMQYVLRIDEAYFDINDTLNIIIFLVYAVIIFLDVFGLAWDKMYLIDNQGIMIILVLDLFVVLLLVCMNMYYKVRRNASFIIFEKTVKLHLQYYKTFYANIDILFDDYKSMESEIENNQDKKQTNVKILSPENIKLQLKRNFDNNNIDKNNDQRRMSKMPNTFKSNNQLQSFNNVEQLLNEMVENKNEQIKNSDAPSKQTDIDVLQQKQSQQQIEAFESIICEYSQDKEYTSDDTQKFTTHSANIQQQYMIKLVREVCIDINLKNKNQPEKYISLQQVELKDVKNQINKLKEKLEYISEKLLIDKEKNQAKFLGLIVLDQKLLSSVIASAAVAIASLIAQIVSSELQKKQ